MLHMECWYTGLHVRSAHKLAVSHFSVVKSAELSIAAYSELLAYFPEHQMPIHSYGIPQL